MQVFSSLLDIKNLNLQGKNLAVALGTLMVYISVIKMS